MIDNRADERSVSRTWAGVVDESTFRRFAAAWRLADQSGTPTAAGEICTFDGMNWVIDDASPIIYVTVEVTPSVTGASENAPTTPLIRAPASAAERAIIPAGETTNPVGARTPLITARQDPIGTRISSAPDPGHANAPPPSRGDAFAPHGWFG